MCLFFFTSNDIMLHKSENAKSALATKVSVQLVFPGIVYTELQCVEMRRHTFARLAGFSELCIGLIEFCNR